MSQATPDHPKDENLQFTTRRNIKVPANVGIEIFKNCFERAGIRKGDSKIFGLLANEIRATLRKGNYIRPDYLRIKHNQLERALYEGGNGRSVIFERVLLNVLIDYAGITNFDDFVKSLNSQTSHSVIYDLLEGDDINKNVADEPTRILKSKLHSDEFCSDKEDVLGYELFAYNLFEIMRDKFTMPPLNVGILAPWGIGKTSLMRRLENLFIQEREKEAKIPASIKNAMSIATIKEIKDWLNGKMKKPIDKIPYPTVWFNPWNYQSSDMIWSGMANAIVEQVINQLPDNISKAAFSFQLRLSRLDKQELQKELHLRTILFASQFFIWGLTAVLSLILFFIKSEFLFWVLGVGTISGLMNSLASLLNPIQKIITDFYEKFSKPPQYLNKLGTFHEVQEDLKKIFDLLIDEKKPVVIFVDDLDRCSPSKIVEVVEAINIFISGDHRKKTYFVLGMDAEIVAASLDVAYDKMKGKVVHREDAAGSLGWHFLDKFIQLPFFVPTIGEENKLHYLKSLFKSANPDTSQIESELHILQDELNDVTIKSEDNGTEDFSEVERDKLILKSQIENYKDYEGIIEQLSTYAHYINSDPRSLKRFANLLRFYNSYQILRKEKGQNYIPLKRLSKYILLMLKFPQFVRWLQWNAENRNAEYSSAILKSKLIDRAIAEITPFKDKSEQLDRWLGKSKTVSGTFRKLNEFQANLPWMMSPNLLEILLIGTEEGSTIANALECNLW